MLASARRRSQSSSTVSPELKCSRSCCSVSGTGASNPGAGSVTRPRSFAREEPLHADGLFRCGWTVEPIQHFLERFVVYVEGGLVEEDVLCLLDRRRQHEL